MIHIWADMSCLIDRSSGHPTNSVDDIYFVSIWTIVIEIEMTRNSLIVISSMSLFSFCLLHINTNYQSFHVQKMFRFYLYNSSDDGVAHVRDSLRMNCNRKTLIGLSNFFLHHLITAHISNQKQERMDFFFQIEKMLAVKLFAVYLNKSQLFIEKVEPKKNYWKTKSK